MSTEQERPSNQKNHTVNEINCDRPLPCRFGIIATLLCALVFISGCGEARLIVQEQTVANSRVSDVRIESETGVGVVIDPSLRERFEMVLRKRLYTKYTFNQGDGMTIKYRVTDADPGSMLSCAPAPVVSPRVDSWAAVTR